MIAAYPLSRSPIKLVTWSLHSPAHLPAWRNSLELDIKQTGCKQAPIWHFFVVQKSYDNKLMSQPCSLARRGQQLIELTKSKGQGKELRLGSKSVLKDFSSWSSLHLFFQLELQICLSARITSLFVSLRHPMHSIYLCLPYLFTLNNVLVFGFFCFQSSLKLKKCSCHSVLFNSLFLLLLVCLSFYFPCS